MKIQKSFKGDFKRLLKILKGHKNLWKSVSKAGEDDLNDFKSKLEPLKNLEGSEKALEREIKLRDLNGNFDGEQLQAEWVWLEPKGVQQRMS